MSETEDATREALESFLMTGAGRAAIRDGVERALESWLRGPGGEVVRDGIENAASTWQR